ncbi:putative succinyl-diaminopimelate desuccinylase [bacterium HR33]|nr:putative succinyl-diaminopimelate desuccinylase [bacterium HR33]
MTRGLLMLATLAAMGAVYGPREAILAQTPARHQSPETYRQLAKDILKELIEIKTTESEGTTRAAEAVAARLKAAGFPEADVRILGPVPHKGNLVARLRGRNTGKKPILLLAHLDVVEADPADWSVDPFKFTEQDGWFYGRGTTDDKDEAAIWTANLIRWKQEGYVPDRDIILALTADEEGGPHNGVEWLVQNHRELIDAAFALNEGGGGVIQNGRRLSHNVQASEKVYQSFRLEVTNRGGHSSLPRSDNAIYQLAAALGRIAAYQFPVKLNEITRAFFERTAAIVSPEEAAAMRGILKDPPDPAAVAKLSAIPAYNSRMRTTCVATMLEGGHAENALPQRAAAVVNCRILPGEPPEEVLATLRRVVADPEVKITPIAEAKPSPPSPLTPEIMGAIEEITQEMWPGVPVIPTMSTGATDALYLRRAGIPVYGVSGVFGDIDDVRAHGRDERIHSTWFFDGLEFGYRLVKRLTGG